MSIIIPPLVVKKGELTPLKFMNLSAVEAKFPAGTHSLRGFENSFAIHCESAGDLVTNLTRGRDAFLKNLQVLRAIPFCRLLIVGSRSEIERGDYRSRAEPRAVLASLAALEMRYQVPVVFEPCAKQAALLVERLAFWHWRELAKPFSPKIPTPFWSV